MKQLSKTTLGNLGSSRSSCTTFTALSDEVQLVCSYGFLKEIGIFGLGVSKSSCDNFGSSLVVDEKCEYGDKFADKQSIDTAFQN